MCSNVGLCELHDSRRSSGPISSTHSCLTPAWVFACSSIIIRALPVALCCVVVLTNMFLSTREVHHCLA